MTKTRSALVTSTAIVAVLLLAACQNRPREAEGTPVQPVAEAAGPADATNRATVTPAPGAPSGAVVSPEGRADSGSIRWNDQQPNQTATVPGAPVGPAVNWRSGLEGNVVWVEIIDPQSYYRVDQVNLVAPDGQAFASRDINRTRQTGDSGYGGSGPNIGIGFGTFSGGGWHGGGTSTGVGIGVPLGGGGGSASDDNATHTVARFQLADPDSYNRTAANWTVHVRLVDNNGQPSVARFPAPAVVRY
jgi:hypothetical protein